MCSLTVIDSSIIGLFAFWFLLSLIVYLPLKGNRVLSILNTSGLIPAWGFFAPDVPRGDFILCFRDKLVNSEITPWYEVKIGKPRTFLCGIWNPERRVRHCVFDIITELIRMPGYDGNPENIEWISRTVPYLTIVNYLSHRFLDPSTKERQFCFVLSHGLEEKSYTPLFFSRFHQV